MAYVCGSYNKKTGKIGQLHIVMMEEEEIRDGYETGEIIGVKDKLYVLMNRKATKDSRVVQYDMILQKGAGDA